jgi:putative endonuclease
MRGTQLPPSLDVRQQLPILLSFRTASAVRNLLFHNANEFICHRPFCAVAVKPSWMVRNRRYYVYIRASKSRVLYTGVTGSLMSRILQHKRGEGSSFMTKYRVNRLVWYQSFEVVHRAIARETEIKGWRREKKINLIEEANPTWEDLAADWGERVEMRCEQQVPHR